MSAFFLARSYFLPPAEPVVYFASGNKVGSAITTEPTLLPVCRGVPVMFSGLPLFTQMVGSNKSHYSCDNAGSGTPIILFVPLYI